MIDLQITDQIATITLSRADKYNAFTEPMAMQMQEALDKCKEPDVRCIVIRGAGKAFCAGQDLEEATAPDAKPIDAIVEDHYNPIVLRLREIEKPVVAAVHGIAAGAGANLALACDIVIASESASFLQAFSKIGLVPDTGGTWILPRLVGYAKATALMMLAERVSATDAEKMGMIYKAVPDADFEATVQKLTHDLAHMPTRGLGLTKRALNRSEDNSLENQLGIEKQLQAIAFGTRDSQEGIIAFKQKRKAIFTGE